MKKKIQDRHIGIDILRVIAMLSVVFLHTIYSFTVRTDFFLTKSWFIFEPLAVLSRSSLVLFFMISGYLVVHKNRTVKDNLKTTINRIVIPFFFFSIFASLFHLFKNGKSLMNSFNPSYIFEDVMKFPDNWLWFLGVMLFLYLLNPLWQELFNSDKKRTSAQYITVFFFVFTITAVLLKFLTHTLTFFNSYTTWIGYVCCYLYGALAQKKWGLHKSNVLSVILFMTGIILGVTGDYFSILNQKNGTPLAFAGYFTDNIALPPLLIALGLFNFFIHFENWKDPNNLIFKYINIIIGFFAGLSYGIYLIHQFIVLTLYDMCGWSVDSAHTNIYIFFFIVYAITLFGAAAITFFISRIPKLRMIIGNS